MALLRFSVGRKSRYIRIAAVVLVLLPLLYLLSTWNQSDRSYLRNAVADRLSYKEKPKLVKELGNYEPKSKSNIYH